MLVGRDLRLTGSLDVPAGLNTSGRHRHPKSSDDHHDPAHNEEHEMGSSHVGSARWGVEARVWSPRGDRRCGPLLAGVQRPARRHLHASQRLPPPGRHRTRSRTCSSGPTAVAADGPGWSSARQRRPGGRMMRLRVPLPVGQSTSSPVSSSRSMSNVANATRTVVIAPRPARPC